MIPQKRTAPRIISRRPIPENQRSVVVDASGRNLQDVDDIHDELGTSGFVVKDGFVVQKPGSSNANRPVTINIHQRGYSSDQSEEIIDRDTPVTLPGIADKLESYPCHLCGDDERIFLTKLGLEKHATECHPEKVDELREIGECISNEWARRKALQDAIFARTSHAMKGEGESSGAGEGETDGKFLAKIQGPQFTECPKCSKMIDVQNPRAIYNHKQLHYRSEQLYEEIKKNMGSEVADRLTCTVCTLVFPDDVRLAEHMNMSHFSLAKRNQRRYICRWCARIFICISDLNVHKRNVHRIQFAQTAAIRTGQPDSTGKQHEEKDVSHETQTQRCSSEPTNKNLAKGKKAMEENLIVKNYFKLRLGTKCDLCELVLIRPSLLLRHMNRVHNRRSFSAQIITSLSMPPLNFDIDVNGRVTWSCCGISFTDKESIATHRRNSHQRHLLGVEEQQDQQRQTANFNLQPDGVPNACQEVMVGENQDQQ